MPEDIDNSIIEKVRFLYQNNEVARRFLDHCAERERDASATSIDRIAYRLEISRESAIELAREFEEAGIGTFMVGRRGHKSRFEWDFSCISVGQVASGETTSLEEPDDAVEEIGSSDDYNSSSGGVGALTLAQAKEGLSKSLGVPIDAIQINIQA